MQTKNAIDSELDWVEAALGYTVAIGAEGLVFRNPKGKVLSAVPREVRASSAATQLEGMGALLAEHSALAGLEVERWMLQSLVVPLTHLRNCWRDPAMRNHLSGLLIQVTASDDPLLWGVRETGVVEMGFLIDVPDEGRLCLIDEDGFALALAASSIRIPHPLALADLTHWQTLAAERGVVQRIEQLQRSSPARPGGWREEETVLETFAGKTWRRRGDLLKRAHELGATMTGGWSCLCTVEGDRLCEARLEISQGDDHKPARLGMMVFADERGRPLPLGKVGALGAAEGLRFGRALAKGAVTSNKSGR